ncbi:aldo/keto reductase [Pseudochrobactrum sp. HB0163]|uniref:aldo/keto reductase n=1 Tax=Pseudochrobactrum sp. HB0163 TaxID=3450708 RepID=UPI003F6DC7B9
MTVAAIKLNDGNFIPQLGFGVWRISDEEAVTSVSTALETGYRHIDTAAIYKNEQGVGRAIRNSGIARKDIFLTTKVWNDDQGYDATLKAFEASSDRLGTDYFDLYLIHWPMPNKDLFSDTWRALIRLREEGRVKSIGVSNFRTADLRRLQKETDIIPAVNQIELHPYFQQDELRQYHQQHNIATEAWSPLGQGKILDNPVLTTIAAKHNKSVAQIILRWHLDIGNIIIPKSVTPQRIRENFAVTDFKLSGTEHDAINKLDAVEGRIGPDPTTFG